MIGTYDADHPLIQRPDTVLAWVKPTSIDYEAGVLKAGKAMHELDNFEAAIVAGIKTAFGVVEETT